MADGGRIDFTVGFKSDTQGLQQIKAELNELRKITPTMLKEINPTWDMSKARSEFMKVEKTINEVSKAFDNAFNPQLGIANIQKLNSSLQKIGIDKIYNQFSSLGTAGTQAFQKIASASLTTNLKLKDTQTILDKIGNTLINSLKWNISSSVVNNFANSIQQAWGYAKHLDSSLNDIRIVTGKSADEMNRFAKQANSAAKRLGASTTDYTEASLIYYQQGLSDEEAAARAETTIKAANITGQSSEAVSEQLTAVWNGYKVSAEETELYIDKLAAVAATTASDLEELSTGMSKVASAASIMGVDIDQLNAQLATIVSVTREAPESIGTALKTVYARMSDITAGLDGEVSLDEYTQQMKNMGINVLDTNGNLRDMGDIIEEIGGKWQIMTREQQTSLAQTIAGTRQYSRMMSLFDNWDMYEKALNTSATAAETLNEQNEIYLEKTEAHIQELRTSLEGLYDSLINTESINTLIDLFSTLINGVETFVDSIGGGGTALLLLGSIATKVFSKNIAENLFPIIKGMKDAKANTAALKGDIENTKDWGKSQAMDDEVIESMVKRKSQMQQYYKIMSSEEIKAANETIQRIGLIEKEQFAYKNLTKEKLEGLKKVNQVYGAEGGGKSSQRRTVNKALNKATQNLSSKDKQVSSSLGINTTELKDVQRVLNKTKESIDKLQGAKEVLQGIKDSFRGDGTEVKNNSWIEKQKQFIDEYDTYLEEKNQKLKKLQEEQQKIAEEANRIAQEKEQVTIKDDDSEDVVKEKQKKLKQLAKEEENNKKAKEKNKKAIGKAQKDIEEAPKKLANTKKALDQATAALEKAKNKGKTAIADLQNEVNKLGDGGQLTAQQVQKLTESLNKANEAVEKNDFTNFQSAINGIEKELAEAGPEIQQFIQDCQNAFDNFDKEMENFNNKIENEEVQFNLGDLDLELMIDGFSNVASAVGSVITSFMALSNIDDIWDDDTISDGEKIVQTLLMIGTVIGSVVSAIPTFTSGFISIGTALGASSLVAEGTAVTFSAAAKAIWSALEPLVPFIGIAAGVALAIGGIVYALGAEEREMKKAEQSAKENIAAAQTLKEEYENLKNSIDKLKNAEDVLKGLTKGTVEWKEAVMEVNDQVLALIDKYPELMQYLNSSDGVLSIDEEGLDKLLDLQMQRAKTAQVASLQSQIDLKEKQGNTLVEAVEVTYEDTTSGNSTVTDTLGEDQVQSIVSALAEDPTLLDNTAALAEQTGVSENLIQGLLNSDANIQAMIEAERANTEAILTLKSTIAGEHFTGDEQYDAADETTKSIINLLGAEDVSDAVKTKTEDYKSKGTFGDYNNSQMEEQYEQFLEDQGYQNYSVKSKAGEKLVVTINGEEEKINMDTAAQRMGSYYGAKDIEPSDYFAQWDKVTASLGEVGGEAVEKVLTGNAEKLTTEEREAFEALTPEELTAAFEAGGLSPEQIANLGQIFGATTVEGIITGLDNYQLPAIADLKENFNKEQAGEVATQAGTFLKQADYITPNSLEGNTDWQAFETQLEQVKTLFPELQSDVEKLMKPAKQGTEEWIQALERVQSEMGGIAEDADGIFTKEDAEKHNLTEAKLTEQYNRGDITQEQYQQKFQGAMDYELEELGINQEEFDSYTEAVKNLTEQYELSDEMVQRISKDNLKLQKTIDTLTSDWEEYGNVLKSGDKNNIKYAQGMGKIRESVEDMFGTDISDDFIQEHLDDIQKLAEGDLTVFDELQKAATQDILVDIQGVTDVDQLSGEFAELNELIMNTDLENMEIGTSLDTTGFDTALQAMLDSGALTVDQVNAILAGVGFEPEITWEDVPVEQQSGIANDAHIRYRDSEGNMHEATMQSYLESGETGVIQIPVINGSKTSFKGAPKATTGKKKGGGGGGGGGGSAAKPDKKDFVDPETDRYHDVEVALKSINKQMEILNDNRKNLTGAALADSYREELELLDEQISALTQKQKLQKEEQKELQSQGRDISRDGKKVHIKSLSEQGVEFDDKGNITNYNEAIVNRTNEYNQMIESYNNLSADRQTDELKAQMDEAKKDYDQFMEDMERYETLTQDEMEETAKEIADALNKKIELKIEKFSMTIDLKIETREAEQSLEDFKSKMEHRDKTAAGRTKTAANKFKNYMDPETGVQAEIDRVNKIKDDIKKMKSGGHSDVYSEYDEESGKWVDNTKQAEEDLKKYTEQMMNDMEDMEDLMDEINQGLLDTFDEIQEGFDDQIAGYDAVADQINHNISLIEKLYGDNASDKLGEWYDAQLNNSIGKVDMLKKEADFWQKQMENAENDDAYKKAKENWLKSMNELNAAVEDSLDIVIAKYENSIDQVFDKLNNSLTGGKGLKYVGEEWELINTNADRYLDTINATYEVQKLQGKYQDAIKNTDSISAQKKLNDLMSQEIKYLEKKDKLTQYDIDRANMKYDIALKQIALEEAQQNKSSLRLKRDSQGNYSYQYVGDEDDIAKKQQELIDAQNSLYNLDKDQYKQNLDDMYTYYSEFQEKMAEVAKTYGRDSEEYEKYKLLYAEQYGELINNIVAENEYIKLNLMESTYDELNSLYENDQASFEAMTHMKAEQFLNMDTEMLLDLEERLVPGFNGSIQDMINAFSGEEGFEGVMKNVWSEISLAATNFQKNIQTISKASGQDLNDLQVNTDKILTTLQGWVGENDKIVQNAKTSKAAYDKIAKGIKGMADKYEAAKKNATDAATESTELQKELNEETWKKLEAQTALDNLVKKLKEWNNTKPKTKTFVTNYVDNSSGSGSGGSGGGGTPTPKSGSSTGSGSPVKWYAYGSSGKLSNTGYSSQTAAKNAWPNAKKFLTYKTGGYTGTWANGSREENGKLAFLHQKELVLNEKDTSNFLDAIKEVKSGFNFDNITKAISSQMVDVQRESMRFQNQIARQLNTIIDSIMRIDQSLEQQVNINARFEDVRSSQAIIEAMDQLTNRASQAAFNVRRKW